MMNSPGTRDRGAAQARSRRADPRRLGLRHDPLEAGGRRVPRLRHDLRQPGLRDLCQVLRRNGTSRRGGRRPEPTLEAAFKAGGVHLVAVPIDYSENTRVLVDELAAACPRSSQPDTSLRAVLLSLVRGTPMNPFTVPDDAQHVVRGRRRGKTAGSRRQVRRPAHPARDRQRRTAVPGLTRGAEDASGDAGCRCRVFEDVVADPPSHVDRGRGGLVPRRNRSTSSSRSAAAPRWIRRNSSPISPSSDDRLDAIYGVGLAKGERLPLILCPTTAGTGSEVTPIAIVTTPTHREEGRRRRRGCFRIGRYSIRN